MSGTIAVIGSLNVDFITTTSRVPVAGETLTAIGFNTGLGGKGANQAVACSRLSRPKSSQPGGNHVKTMMVGAVGDDSFGSDFLAALLEEGIDTTNVQRVTGQKTGIANIIVVESTGENRILVATNANHASGEKLVDLVPRDADVLVFQLEIPLQLVLHNVQLGHSQGKYTIMNPAPAVRLPGGIYESISCLIMNESETELLWTSRSDYDTILKHASSGKDPTFEEAGHMADYWFALGVQDLLIITLGANGVFYFARHANKHETRTKGHIQGIKAKVVDTTAAGDTFVGALATQIARNGGKTPDDPRSFIEFANRAAARTVEKSGAMAAIPWLDEVLEQ